MLYKLWKKEKINRAAGDNDKFQGQLEEGKILIVILTYVT